VILSIAYVIYFLLSKGCSAALGMKSKEIEDYQLSASSSYPEAQPSQARESKKRTMYTESEDRLKYIL
jgi:hypothetical protein